MKNTYHNIIFIAFLTLYSCGEKQKESTPEIQTESVNTISLTEEQMLQANISLIPPMPGSIPVILKLNGITESAPMDQVQVCAPMGGFLKSTTLTPGQFIQEGQTIVMLEDQQFIDIQEEYLTTKAMLALSNTEFERQNQLNKTKSSSDKVLENARTEFVSKKIALKALEEKLKLLGLDPTRLNEENISRMLPLKAPISGYVSDLKTKIGQYVNPTDIILSITNNTRPFLILRVFEKDISSLKSGQKVQANSSAFPEQIFSCSIVSIGRELDQNRSVDVVCTFDNTTNDLRPGLYFTGETEVQLKDGLLVPSEAVVHYENKNYIFVTTGQRAFLMTEVELIGEHEQQSAIQLLSPTTTDSIQIAGRGAYSILMKMKNSEE
ncbi:MAG: efflux RND transporter periplasmic adaptor subunit [Flavobacteriales bacterium]|nr:efflux RND transporter periplasmic adaptor subunit [Flavobacteriales bacterium]